MIVAAQSAKLLSASWNSLSIPETQLQRVHQGEWTMPVRSPQHGGASLGSTAKPLREAVLLAPARCTGTKRPFAIRFEVGAHGIWQACAAFAISDRQLSNPAFSSDHVTSSALLSSSYPGCPHCGTDSRREFAGVSFVKCSCGRLACSSGIIGAETLCPWCGRVGTLARHGFLPVVGMKDR
jgi:TerY-like protein